MFNVNKRQLSIFSLVAFGVMGGLIAGQLMGAYGQNGTVVVTGNATVDAVDKLVYVAVVPIAIAVLSFLSQLAQKGRFDKKTSDALIMAADASHAVMDTRETFNKYANATYEIAKLTAPEQVKKLDEQYAPLIDAVANRVMEYKDKVAAFEAIASGNSKAGEKSSDSMKSLRNNIPNNIMPSGDSS